ncbi:transposase [Desulfovirgula thermocuniculi]|uniref:transposase n=1 Tax=Desulfovirgula thermocuniculi TaxID=348842 RepID=UPI0004836E46|nr:transposase [Desulfovirgula thermocuniculi]
MSNLIEKPQKTTKGGGSPYMVYIQQPTLFPFEVFVHSGCSHQHFFSALLSIDVEPIRKMFPLYQGTGRPGYDRTALFRALVLKTILELPSIEALVKCLSCSKELMYYCGFDIRKPPPSPSVFYRFLAELRKMEGQKLLGQVVQEMMAKVAEEAAPEGKVVIDTTDIPARERPPKGDAGKEESTSLGSAWGYRTASSPEETPLFYGYKLHVAMAPTSIGPIPLALRIAPANVPETEIAPILMREAHAEHKNLFGIAPEYYVMDAGYDARCIYEQALALGGQAIIKLNMRNRKKPFPGFNEDGTPLCPAGYPMVYWGAEKERKVLKFRCPKAAGRKVECDGQCACANPYGLVVRVRVKDNPRLFCYPHRGSPKWQEIYNCRSSIERWFALLKEHLRLDKMTRRGIDNAFIDTVLCITTFLAGTLAALKLRKRYFMAA